MNPNPDHYATPETSKLLEDAGLITINETEMCWLFWDGNDKLKPKLEHSSIFQSHSTRKICAPGYLEIWERLPDMLALSIKNSFYELHMTKSVIGYYNENMRGCRFECHTNGNPADAAGRLLYQLHKDGKLNKK